MQEHEFERESEDWDDLSDLPDPWDGDHTIEYWVWNGARLIPATLEERARIQEDERTRAARLRLQQMQEREQHEGRSLRRQLSTAVTWCVGHGRMTVTWPMTWLRSRWSCRQVLWTARPEGARVERSSTTGSNAADSERQQGFQPPR